LIRLKFFWSANDRCCNDGTSSNCNQRKHVEIYSVTHHFIRCISITTHKCSESFSQCHPHSYYSNRNKWIHFSNLLYPFSSSQIRIRSICPFYCCQIFFYPS
ncbi:hypothetical protein T03_5540, partial [Trichinella britovi]